MFSPMFIWVTRSSPYNLLTCHRLRAMGHSALAAPLLRVKPVRQSPLGRRPDALVFTSTQAVRHHLFERHLARTPVFTVGESTARAARRAGYRDVRSARGNVSALQKLVATTVARPAHVVHYSAREPAGDLAGYLERSGYDAERRIVYESLEVDLADLKGATAALSMVDGIMVHSPKGARQAAALIADARWYGIVLCISEACARAFDGLPGLLVETAAEPTESGLMTLLRQLRGPPARRNRGRLGAAQARMAVPFAREQAPPATLTIANDNGGSPPAANPSCRKPAAPRKGPDEPQPPTAA